MNNRLWNAKNPYQGNAERILCVCSAGLLRSPTIANVLAARGYNTRAVGLDNGFALIPIDEVLIKWADTVITVDFSTTEEIVEKWKFEGDVINLGIPDEYEFNQPELIDLINRALPEDRSKWNVWQS